MVNLIPWRRKQTNVQDASNTFWDPFGAEDFLSPASIFRSDKWLPVVDIREGKRHITVGAEIPGMDKNDIDISLENGILRIKGEKRQEKEDGEENYHRIESSYGYFSRAVELPAEVDPERVEAKYKRGILTIKMKKTRDTKSRKIKIASV